MIEIDGYYTVELWSNNNCGQGKMEIEESYSTDDPTKFRKAIDRMKSHMTFKQNSNNEFSNVQYKLHVMTY